MKTLIEILKPESRFEALMVGIAFGFFTGQLLHFLMM